MKESIPRLKLKNNIIMIKNLLTAILFFCISTSLNAQTIYDIDKYKSCGNYYFQQLTVSVYNLNTHEEILQYVVEDTEFLDILQDQSLPQAPIFLSAKISRGTTSDKYYLSDCLLWNNEVQYKVSETGEFSLLDDSEEDLILKKVIYKIEENPFPLPFSLSPAQYELQLEKENITFTFLVSYGNSKYNFPLIAKLVLIMHKDKKI